MWDAEEKRNFANLMTNKYDYTESAGCSVL